MNNVKETKPQWSVGDTVWYDPTTVGLLFRATIKSEPKNMAGGLWVVSLEGLPPEYRQYSGRTSFSVLAPVESPCTIYDRDPNDDRNCIRWDEYQSSKSTLRSSTLKGVVDEAEEATGS
jgi:hypothetical protein